MILLVFLAIFLQLGDANPVIGGKDVGDVLECLNEVVVINPATFAYVVRLIIIPLEENPSCDLIAHYFCGGVIIKPDVVLTAAHCIASHVNGVEIVAWAGIVDTEKQKEQGQRIEVKHYKVHEEYVRNGLNPNDIALLWLRRPFDTRSPYIDVAELPKKRFNVKGSCGFVAGWGRTANGERPSMLQVATTTVLEQIECQKYYNFTLSDKVICTLSDDRKSGGSYGDSGGPFVVHNTVVGISSFGGSMYILRKDGHQVKVPNPNRPTIYTKVSEYAGWIKSEIKKRSKSPPRQPPPPPPPKRVSSLKIIEKLNKARH